MITLGFLANTARSSETALFLFKKENLITCGFPKLSTQQTIQFR